MMMLSTIWQKDKETVLVFFIGLAYLVGVLSPHRLGPYAEFMPDAETILVLLCGLIYYLYQTKTLHFSRIQYFWLSLLVLICLQPIMHDYIYPQVLLYPLIGLLIANFLCLVAVNIEIRVGHIKLLAAFLIIASLVTVVIQLLQVYTLSLVSWGLALRPNEYPSAFLFQRNQAAFIHALALVCVLYAFLQTQILSRKLLTMVAIVLISLAITLTASRVGLLLLILLSFCPLVFCSSFRPKSSFKQVAMVAVLFSVGYLLGSYILQSHLMLDDSLSRVGKGNYSYRLSLLQQAWLNFTEAPILGVGWSHFNDVAIRDPSQVDWFSNVNHSHFFISHLFAELGLMALVLLIIASWALWSPVCQFFTHKQHASSAGKKIIFALLFVIMIYSCTEFPLWIGRYLFLFAFLVGLLYDKAAIRKQISAKLIQVLRVLAIVLLGGVLYGYVQYNQVQKIYYAMQIGNQNLQPENKVKAEDIVGISAIFEQYKDYYLYTLIPYSESSLDGLLQLGDRVRTFAISSELFLKQGMLLIAKGDNERAMIMIQRSCQIDFPNDCLENIEKLQVFLENNQPLEFDLPSYGQWVIDEHKKRHIELK